MKHLEETIELAYENRARGFEDRAQVEAAVAEAIGLLDAGKARVAEPVVDGWHVNQWLKKAVLLSFALVENKVVESGHTRFYDKVALKYADYSEKQFAADSVRVVPDAVVRHGSYVAPDVVLMPSFVNIGAYIDRATMVDTWATVGSCAQIGRNVHLSGGVGIGGVLEPLQAGPTIIEDDCFIGARSEVVEGVVVEKGSVISMGVYLGQSTRIYNRETGEISYGRIPAGSVVVAGNLPSADGLYSLYCAVIVKQVDAKTRAKTALNDLLRNLD
jgi:2,3,4,5-tetrahydropyridine-2-carboxylate N-succinyltransferase